jgi:hypothetical protein
MDTITEAWTIGKFYKYMDVSLHTTYFYQVGTHAYPFGCEKGFLNDYDLHKHIQKDMCEGRRATLQRYHEVQAVQR